MERRRGKQRIYCRIGRFFFLVPLTSFPQPPSLFIVPKSMDRNRKMRQWGNRKNDIVPSIFRHSYSTRKTFVRFRCQTFPVVVSKGDVRVRRTSRRANEKKELSSFPLHKCLCVRFPLFCLRVTIKKRERETHAATTVLLLLRTCFRTFLGNALQ